jgi:Zn-dependent protease with chaperone function
MALIRPAETTYKGRYFDGRHPVRHYAAIDVTPEGLHFTVGEEFGEGKEGLWPYTDLTLTDRGAYGEPVRVQNSTGEVLTVTEAEFARAMAEHWPEARRTVLDLHGGTQLLFAMLAIAIIGGFLYTYGVGWASATAARYFPPFLDDRIGKSVVTLLAPPESLCTDPQARARLQPVLDRLSAAAGPPYRFTIQYSNLGIVNAFAAPGGYIVVFQGLLDRTETPEQFAGVLAHEMEHVIHRHAAAAIAREFSGRALLSLMAVDSSGTPTALQAGARLANLSYQRSDEAEADLAGVELLNTAHIQAAGLGEFLKRVAREDPRGVQYLSTHPATGDRVDALNEAARKYSGPIKPLLSKAEWERARRVCNP